MDARWPSGIGKMLLIVKNNTVYTYEMSHLGYVNIIKVALFKVTRETIIKSIY